MTAHFTALPLDGASGWRADPRARLVHFVRHGEALHQRAARQSAVKCRCLDDRPPTACPYWDDALIDAPLTEEGRRQVTGLLATHDVERVWAAADARSLETACLACAPARDGGPPITAHEALRARVGPHRHSRRRPRAQLEASFGARVDLSLVVDDVDTLWRPTEEPRAQLDGRVAAFIEMLGARPERAVAVVTHFTVLVALFSPAREAYVLGENIERDRDDAPFIDIGLLRAEDAYMADADVRSLVLTPRSEARA